MGQTITLTVNGEPWSIDVEPNDVLLDVLRARIGVKSPKVGCERGECGTCTVMMDGRTVRSCLVLAIEANGSEIVTVEGLSVNGPTPLQRAFIDRNAFQCGFCAPGIVLTATELLEDNPSPTEDEVKEAIAGNLCRCTGYTPIIEAVMAVAGVEQDRPQDPAATQLGIADGETHEPAADVPPRAEGGEDDV
jgi:carbon-monoxide dehydrogenase small subunit